MILSLSLSLSLTLTLPLALPVALTLTLTPHNQVRYYPEVKADGSGKGSAPLEGEAALLEQRRWQLESALAAIDPNPNPNTNTNP